MLKTRTFGKAPGNWPQASKVDFVPSWPHVCLFWPFSSSYTYMFDSYEIWDEYTRRQYLAKAPHLNPYGAAEEPKHFIDFDVFQKIRVLHQLSVWTFWNPDRLREKMPEQREGEQVQWVGSSPYFVFYGLTSD